MEKNRLLSMLGLCKKAGQLLQGYEAVREAVIDKRAVLVLVAADISDGSRKKIRRAAEEHGTEYYDIEATIQELGEKTRRYAGILAVTDQNFARGIVDIITLKK